MKKVTLSAKWLGVVFAALFLAACSSNETKEAEAAAAAARLRFSVRLRGRFGDSAHI